MDSATTIVGAGALLAVLVIPILAALCLAKAKEFGDAGKGKVQRWTHGNWYTYALLVSALLYVALQMVNYRLSHPEGEDGELRLFTQAEYDQELTGNVAALPTPDSRTQLLRKFEHATYALNRDDHARAEEAFRQLEDGLDAHGALPNLRSSVVANNLGVVTFSIKRNQGFIAYSYLAEAKARVPPGSPFETVILQNIERLDVLVNTLD